MSNTYSNRSMWNKLPLAVFAAVIATTALASTLIGHPVPTKVADGDGLEFNFAEIPISTMKVDRCNGTTETFDLNTTLDLIAGDTITLPNGWVCGVLLTPTGRAHISGDGTAGGTFSLSIQTGGIQLAVSPNLLVTSGSSAATAVRFADLDWVTASDLGLAPGVHTHVNPSHPLHSDLRDSWKYDGEVEQ